jgi:hypothetical protein
MQFELVRLDTIGVYRREVFEFKLPGENLGGVLHIMKQRM